MSAATSPKVTDGGWADTPYRVVSGNLVEAGK